LNLLLTNILLHHCSVFNCIMAHYKFPLLLLLLLLQIISKGICCYYWWYNKHLVTKTRQEVLRHLWHWLDTFHHLSLEKLFIKATDFVTNIIKIIILRLRYIAWCTNILNPCRTLVTNLFMLRRVRNCRRYYYYYYSWSEVARLSVIKQ